MATKTSTADILIRARDQASAKLGLIAKSAGQMTSMLRTAALGVTGYLSARAIIGFAKSSIAAFAEDQAAVVALTAALDTLNAAAEIGRHKAFAAQLQRMTVIGDETTLSMMAMGASMGKLTGDALQRATVAAVGLSKAYGIELTAAMRLVSRAAVGDTAQLKRYGIVMDETLSKEERFGKLLEIGAAKFNLARAEASTFSGSVKQLANAWGDAKERLGQYLVDHPKFDAAIRLTTAAISNIDLSMKFVFTSIKLQVVELAETFKYYFTEVIPASIGNLGVEILKRLSIKGGIDQLTNIYGMLFKGEEFSVQKLLGWEGIAGALDTGKEKAGPRADSPYLAQLRASADAAAAALAEGFKQHFDAALPAGGAGSTGAMASLLSAGRAREGVAAVESRFLSGTGSPLNDYQKQTAQNTRRQIALLEKIAAGLDRQMRSGQAQLAPVMAAATLF